MESHLEEAVFGIVALAAAWAFEIAAPGGALVIVVFGDREGGAATARDQEHAERRRGFLSNCLGPISLRGAKATRLRDSRGDAGATPGLVPLFHNSSSTAIVLFLRLLACRTFLRRRRDLGVISTNSSSAINSIACSRFNGRKGTRRMASSAVEARMLVSFFSRTALTSRSLSLAFSPMIMPS